MATEEARQMLDALMGGDRNAALPPGAAMPRSKKKRKAGGEMLLLPGKRSKSCFDPDIDPLYCAWGIDVFELFVNTKSDIGPNPYVVDESARQEFLKLPEPEQERLGFYYFLFQKLQELVRSGDRTVQRNKEKLAQELRRLAAKRGANPASQPVVDYVQDVDEQAVEGLARNQLEFDFLSKNLETELLVELDAMQEEEDDLKQELSGLLEVKRVKDKKDKADEEEKNEKEGEVKEEEANGEESTKIKEEPTTTDEAKGEDGAASEQVPAKMEEDEKEPAPPAEKNPRIQSLQVELGKLTMKKQRVLWETARIMSQVAPLQEAMDSQLRNLLYVKSDIAADKTVCEVSGNFMSARDADERIAAHYAGKQFVGWKLVRERLKEMMVKYGRYGPPPPDRSGNRAPAMGMHNNRGPPPRGNSGGGRFGGGGGGFNDRGGRGRGRFDGGGGGWGGDRGDDRGGRWERHGPGGPPHDRRGGGGGGRGGGWRR